MRTAAIPATHYIRVIRQSSSTWSTNTASHRSEPAYQLTEGVMHMFLPDHAALLRGETIDMLIISGLYADVYN